MSAQEELDRLASERSAESMEAINRALQTVRRLRRAGVARGDRTSSVGRQSLIELKPRAIISIRTMPKS